MPHALHFLIFTAAGWLNRRQEDLIDYLREENRVLREQLGGRPLRLTDAQRRRLAIRGQKLGRRVLSRVAGIVTPDTILRWYRRLIAQKYDGSARRRRGRPLTPQAIGELVVRMAIENPRWGYTRIRGALANLGHEIGRNTVKRILLSRGMAPAPERGQRTPWKTFLQAHWDGLAATDLFTVEVLTLEGLKRYLVLFVIELRTRYVHVVGIHPQPDGAWMEQMARNLTDPVRASCGRHGICFTTATRCTPMTSRRFSGATASAPCVFQRAVPISMPMPSGSFAPSKRNVSAESCRWVRDTSDSLSTSMSSTTTGSGTIKVFRTSCCAARHRLCGQRPGWLGGRGSAGCSTSTIARPRDCSAD